jgi:hypothetical protein
MGQIAFPTLNTSPAGTVCDTIVIVMLNEKAAAREAGAEKRALPRDPIARLRRSPLLEGAGFGYGHLLTRS